MKLSALRAFAWPWLALLAPLAAPAFGGCSNSGTTTTPDSACASLASSIATACKLPVAAALAGAFGSQAACTVGLSLPGSPSATAITKCADALVQTGCADGIGIPECALSGTLAAGTDCNEDIQCLSDKCTVPAGGTCGTCATVQADGQACGPTAGCRAGAACISGTCTEVTYGTSGVACNDMSALCASGLYCTSAKSCAPVPTLGQPCGTTLAFATGICASPYGCGDANTCVARGGAGAACPCESGFSCGLPFDGGAGTCVASPAPPTAGATCAPLEACEVGRCDLTTLKCPTVIADGQPCQANDASAVCNTTSTCANGVCGPASSTVAVCK